MQFTMIFRQWIFASVCLFTAANSSGEIWKKADPAKMASTKTRYIKPLRAQYFEPDMALLQAELESCPKEQSGNIRHYGKIISFPMPDGKMARFAVAAYDCMEPELAAKWDFARTYTGQGIDDPAASMKADITAAGFHYQILSPSGSFYADPVFLGDVRYIQIYDKKDLRISDKAGRFVCGFAEENGLATDGAGEPAPSVQISSGSLRRVYRLAVATTGEYTSFHGGATGAASAIVTSVNRVGGVYELEVAVRFILVANNNLLIYTNANSDPYTNNNGGTMLGQNQTNINNVIGSANYDIGHVFSTGGGGIASLGSVCSSANKARGVTGSPQPVGDPFDIDYVAHEIGHQYGGNHTFNSQTGSCGGGNRSANSAFEPGSGTTIMAYAGICGADDLQNNSNAYFVFKSYEDITNFISNNNTGGSCPVKQNSGNTPPEIPAITGGFTIPVNTPFRLTAPPAIDADGDALTYCWEQSDLGAAGAPGNTTGPIIRSFSPVASRERVVPRLASLLANTTVIGEKLPTVARSMSFKLLVRDNFAGSGGANQGTISFSVNATGGAFSVTSPNTNTVVWESGSTQTITWNAGSTASAPFNTPFVRIKLSTDGGNTYPYTLADSTQNDGSASVQIPLIPANSLQCRVMVEALGNIFFDISNANFRINTPSTASIPMTLDSPASICAGQSFKVVFNPNDATVYTSGNVFSISLSDAFGNFVSPLTIGFINAVSADTITANIPANLASGTGYKLRIASSNPPRTGNTTIDAPDINALPPTPAGITGPLDVCNGNTVTYSVAPASGTTGFSWLIPAGCQIVSANTDSSNISLLFSGNGGALSVAGKNSCGKGLPKSVSISPAQVLPASVTASASSLNPCQGTEVTFNSTPINGGLSPQFQWLKNGLPIAGATAQTYTTSSLVSGDNFKVVLISSLTCGNLNSDTSSGLTINVNQPQTPTASIESDAQADTACQGIPVTFLSTITTGGGTLPKYAWFRNTTQVSGQTQSTLTLSNLVSGDSVRLRLTVTGSCLTSTVVFSPAIRITIANFTANAGADNTVCPGSVSQLAGTPSGGTWSGANVNAAGFFTAPASGSSLLTYSVNKYGCVRTDIRVVSVFQLPNVNFTFNADTLTGAATGAVSWVWYLNDSVISGAVGQNLIITQPGEYCVEATFGNGCSKKSNCIQVIPTSVEQAFSSGLPFRMWPNPAGSEFMIEIPEGTYGMELISTDGRDVLSMDLTNRHGNLSIPVGHLAEGLYQVRLINDAGHQQTARLIIRK